MTNLTFTAAPESGTTVVLLETISTWSFRPCGSRSSQLAVKGSR